MKLFKMLKFLFLANIFIQTACKHSYYSKLIPLVVTTWDYKDATRVAWDTLYTQKGSALDAIENGCSFCEQNQCRGTVGFGGSPDENGETTLDAMIMDGLTMDVGAVGSLRNVKNAISVARHVLENTAHSLIVGDLATKFALQMGFLNESLETEKSFDMWNKWKSNHCQPNFWKNVIPNSKSSCGPYKPNSKISRYSGRNSQINENNHDTIGMIAIDSKGHIAAGTSTNGARNKIAGRVGDSPIPGAGAYADQEVGAAAATGDGDIMMRFLPSFLVIELMRQGMMPEEAVKIAISRITKHYPTFVGAVIALNTKGNFAAACNGMEKFPFFVSNLELKKPTLFYTLCKNK